MSTGNVTWTDKSERGSAWLIQLIAWLARAVGRPFCRVLLFPIVAYFVLTDRTAREASIDFLSAARGRPAHWRDVFSHLHCFSATLLDRVYMAAGEFERFELKIEGLDLVERATRGGRGCVLLGSHLGSFDLLMLAHRAFDGRPVSVLMRIDPRARLRRIAGIDERAPDLIPIGRPDSFLRAFEALQAGSIVALLADRIDSGACLQTRFLGRTAAMPIAPHLLAARSQAAVLMCFGLYEGHNRYRIEFVEFGEPAAVQSRNGEFQTVVDRYATILERYARCYPLNWFNFYPYWDLPQDRR